MSLGCLNPNAVNYDGTKTEEDYTCKYLFKHDGVCHLFKDVLPAAIEDKSFTLSYSINGQAWVFFHDYFPDMYIHNRESLFSAKDNGVYKHHEGVAGKFYDTAKKSFFIDIVFPAGQDAILQDVQWVTEYLSSNVDQRYSTLTHLSIWNSDQHTGRIPLTQVLDALNYNNSFRTKGQWSFDTLKDCLILNAGTFLGTLFSNFALDNTKVDPAPVWYQQKDMQDSWFCIRFEFDNTVDAKVIIHDTTVHALKSDR